MWLLWHEFWETALDRLEDYLNKLQDKPAPQKAGRQTRKDDTDDRDA